MVFSSLTFLCLFLPLNFIVYFANENITYRNYVLILFSLGFYAWGEPVWITLMILSATVDYFNGRFIEANRGKWQAKIGLLSSIIINLSLLGIFKYSGFMVSNINAVFSSNIPFREFALPIGISFYTFQTLSYTIDVYKGEVAAQKSFSKFLLFVSLFHQLVAGPIVRYRDIADEIDHRTITLDKFHQGINRFVIGLGKKVLIANTAGSLGAVYLEQPLTHLSLVSSWFGILMFALQIYFDFSGYSDMAIGLGRMFGFTYKENFNYPYIAKSATDFWRRWHMSLGSFFRDYVYIPLGGNRSNFIRNLLLVWFLTGLWHGAHWNFILWGLFFGFLILIEKKFLLNLLDKLPNIFGHGYLLVSTLIGWVLFYFTDLSKVTNYLSIMFGLSAQPLITKVFIIQLSNNSLFVLLACLLATPIPKNMVSRFRAKHVVMNGVGLYSRVAFNIVIVIATVALLVGDTYNPFLYFRF